jgi:radical SAM superfamily enzyme YgiQ (UPF0313 family)
MRVGFINTSSRQNFAPFRIAPLGSLLLLTILEQEFGDALQLSFTDLRGIPDDKVADHLDEKDVYLHYVTTPEFAEISTNVARLRQLYPHAKHIAGGPHCNIFPDESMRRFDAICVGEGEEVIKTIIRDALRGSLQALYRQEAPVDLNAYPFPLRKFLPPRAVVDTGLLSKKHRDLLGTTVLFSRGCPYNCHFCSNQYHGPIRYRAPELISAEIEYLKREYGIKALVLKDDNGIALQKQRAISNLRAITGAGVFWRGQTRANGVHPDVIGLARDSGCVEITVAIESAWQRSLDIMNKKIDLAKAKAYIRQIKATGMDVKILLILGMPGEPHDIASRTIAFIEEVAPANVSLSILCPIPGSELYRHPEKFGMKIKPDVEFSKYLFAFGRFGDDEKAPRFFEYEPVTPFGPSLSMDEILANHDVVQAYLRDHQLNF